MDWENSPGLTSEWDDEKAASLLGSFVLIGVSYLDGNGELESQLEAYGLVTEVDKLRGIAVKCEGRTWNGEVARFPPSTRIWYEAEPGEYRLRSTGEVIADPAFTTVWSCRSPTTQ